MYDLVELVEKNPIDLSLKILAREIQRLDNLNTQKPELKINRIYDDVVLPKKAYQSDMCYDVIAYSGPQFMENYVQYSTGLRFEIPEGYDILLFPRSSIRKYDLVLSNSVGVVDQNYRDQLFVCFKVMTPNINDLDEGQIITPDVYKVGDKIAQFRLIKKEDFILTEISEVSAKTDRGLGGYGSSGN